jgi:hypothetical protein
MHSLINLIEKLILSNKTKNVFSYTLIEKLILSNKTKNVFSYTLQKLKNN